MVDKQLKDKFAKKIINDLWNAKEANWLTTISETSFSSLIPSIVLGWWDSIIPFPKKMKFDRNSNNRFESLCKT
jgi:hypothetical protein